MKHIKTFESFVNEREVPAIRRAIDNYNRAVPVKSKRADFMDQLARTIIDNVVGNGPVHYDSSNDNLASVIAKLEELSDGSGKIKYHEDLIYASTYMLESIQLEHHGKDWPEALLNMNLSDFLDKMKATDAGGYERIEQIIASVKDDIVSAPVSEGVGKGHPDIVRVMREIEEWDADMMENLLSDIATNYKIQAPELDNMDAIGIYKHLMEAVKLLKKRTGN